MVKATDESFRAKITEQCQCGADGKCKVCCEPRQGTGPICNKGWTNVYADLLKSVGGGDWAKDWIKTNCACPASGECTKCCLTVDQGGGYWGLQMLPRGGKYELSVRKGGAPTGEMSTETSTHPFGYKNCQSFGCTDAMLGNGVCNKECNHPDCFTSSGQDKSFDGGDCCPETSSGSSTDTNPHICFDPKHSEKHDTYKFEYNEPKCRKKPGDQGQCGSCYAFAGAKYLDNMRCKAGHSHGYLRTSALFQDSCGTPAVHAKFGMCENGGNIWNVVDAHHKYGAPFDGCWPYVYGGDATKHFTVKAKAQTCTQANALYTGAKSKGYCPAEMQYVNKISSNSDSLDLIGLAPNNEAKIKKVIKEQGGAYIGGPWCNAHSNAAKMGDILNPFSGHTLAELGVSKWAECGGHAVALVGYGKFTKAGQEKKFWIMENSYDHTWADKGFFYWDMAVDHSTIGANSLGWNLVVLPSAATFSKSTTVPNLVNVGKATRHLLEDWEKRELALAKLIPAGKIDLSKVKTEKREPLPLPEHRRKLIEDNTQRLVPFALDELPVSLDPTSNSGGITPKPCGLAKYQNDLNKFLTELTKKLKNDPSIINDLTNTDRDQLWVEVEELRVLLPYKCKANVQDAISSKQQFLVTAGGTARYWTPTTKNKLVNMNQTFLVTGNMVDVEVIASGEETVTVDGIIDDFTFEPVTDPNLQDSITLYDVIVEALSEAGVVIPGDIITDAERPAAAIEYMGSGASGLPMGFAVVSALFAGAAALFM